MPNCYLLALCHSSSLDNSTNNWSLFNLIEQIKVREFPFQPPFESHAYWRFNPDEYEIDFEMRLILVSDHGLATQSNPLPLRSNTARLRIRVTGAPPIERPGNYELRVEWRRQGTDSWTRCDSVWPLQVEQLQ
jgi:hypothetical protein